MDGQPRTVVVPQKKENFQRKGKAGAFCSKKTKYDDLLVMAFGFSCFGNKPALDAQCEVRRKILSISSIAADKQHRHVETHLSG